MLFFVPGKRRRERTDYSEPARAGFPLFTWLSGKPYGFEREHLPAMVIVDGHGVPLFVQTHEPC